MSKSILQQIAKKNALDNNSTAVFNVVNDLTNVMQQYKQSIDTEIFNNYNMFLAQLSITNTNIQGASRTYNTNLSVLDSRLSATEDFLISQLSTNFKSLGTLRRETRRDYNSTLAKIDNTRLNNLDYFTGPISTVLYDSENNFTGYSTALQDNLRNWLYTRGTALRYADGSILSVTSDTITIGDTKFTKIVMPGNLTINGNEAINGNLNINSSTGSSITTNKDIVSSANISAGTGLNTIGGDIKTDSGNIISSSGNLDLLSGNAAINGTITSSKGITSQSGDVTIAGNYISTNGGVTCTGAISGANNIGTSMGNLYSLQGELLLGPATGYKIQTSSGNMTMTGTLTSAGLNISGATNIGALTATSITGTSLTLNGSSGIINAYGTGISNFQGGITTLGALSAASLNISGLSTLSGNVQMGGQLTVQSNVFMNSNLTLGSSGSTVTATYFNGIASSAKYSDLAEKYLSDKVYEPGTVLSIGGENEVTLFNRDLPLAGIVSTAPGFKLNESQETEDELYLFIALKGRIPAKTLEVVKKSQYLIPDYNNPGYCRPFGIKTPDCLGVALSDSSNGYVEIKV